MSSPKPPPPSPATPPAMSQTDVVNLMSSSRSQLEWDAYQRHVFGKFRGKPDFWDDAIVKDDIYNKTKKANGWKTP